MRKSRYTTTVSNGDETLLFNTASGAFAALDEEAAQTLEDGAWSGKLAEELAYAGFITSLSPEEERDAIQRRFDQQRSEHDTLTLVLAPTYACNYRCPYCYEQGVTSIPGIMDKRVIDAVLAFIDSRYRKHSFAKLAIQWYGGDPSLALDVVEELSEKMITWCDERSMAYDASILTNCNLIDEVAAEMLARCHVTLALLTIDGFEETHNKRRVAANGSNSFKSVIDAADLFTANGISVSAVMNVDENNWNEFPKLRDKLRAEHGIELTSARLSDCGHFFGARDFKEPEFKLFSPEDFAQLHAKELIAQGLDQHALQAMLQAPVRFCNGQRDDYFVIDCKGDVYDCDGYIGCRPHVMFSLFDKDVTEEEMRFLSHDPFDYEECSNCELLPICLGNCRWERETDLMQHHPLKYTLPLYLRAYRDCFDRDGSSFQLLVSPAEK